MDTHLHPRNLLFIKKLYTVPVFCSIHTHTPTSGRVIGMHTFGASAPLKALQQKFGFEPDRVVAVAKELLGRT